MESGIPTGSLFYFVIILVVVALLVLGALFWLFGWNNDPTIPPTEPVPTISSNPVTADSAAIKAPEVVPNPPVTKVVPDSKIETPKTETLTPTPTSGPVTPASIESVPTLAVPAEPISGLSSVGPMFDIMGLA